MNYEGLNDLEELGTMEIKGCEGMENKARSGAKHDRGKLAKMDIKADPFLCKASYEVI